MPAPVTHATRAAAFVANEHRAHWHDGALWYVRKNRDAAARAVPDWEALREAAAGIKRHTLSRLPDYLEQFESQATRLGATVHWARDAAEHNEIVLQLLKTHGAQRVVKSKSMLTEECHLNPYLERHGIEVTDTDLGERIVQMRAEPPSHIIFPAIHLKREEIGELFCEQLGTEPGLSDPVRLTAAARAHLREKFLAADAGITGVNFGIAETGGVVVITNEGNADLGTSLPKLHIACMGIEKLVPRARDLGIFLRLLARSATGQPISVYSSHFHGPAPGAELHIVLVDNGRSRLLTNEPFRDALACIRCGACLNTCPVYRRSGGYSYDTTVPGPIGSVLAPARSAKRHQSLPSACSLCGSCRDVCPVQIDLPLQLLTWRRELVARGITPAWKLLLAKLAAKVLRSPALYQTAGSLLRRSASLLPRFALYGAFNPWGRGRELPDLPRYSFRELHARRRED